MKPILLQLGAYSLSSLGGLIFLGFFFGSFLVWRRLKELGLIKERILDLIVWSGVASLFLARGLFIAFHWGLFSESWQTWWRLEELPGLEISGFLFGPLLVGLWLGKRWRWELAKVADEIVFGWAVFLTGVSLGFLLDGSFLGSETGFFLGVFFPGQLIRRHPLPGYLALLFLLLLLFLWRVERRWRRWSIWKNKKEGALFWLFALMAGAGSGLFAFLAGARVYSFWLRILFLLLLAGVSFWRLSLRVDFDEIKKDYRILVKRKRREK